MLTTYITRFQYLHVPATGGGFYNDSAYRVCSPPDTGELEKLFRHEVFKILKVKPKEPRRKPACKKCNSG
ncbi:hypothetical protein D3OALGA1CA_4947 [Olavius algarvensis associated proteobacterium Delta 3]|nr:hypothetical protein D3OALGA1CA_4947 [Olavius algarvensis associated proteobacterium Delta 3]